MSHQIPFRIAIRQLDYVGGALFIVAASLILTGIVYTTILGASSTKVIGTLGKCSTIIVNLKCLSENC